MLFSSGFACLFSMYSIKRICALLAAAKLMRASNSSSLINTSRDWSLVYQSLIGHFKILLADRYPDILDYLRLLAKRECFINGMSYSEFVYTCPEINRNLINLINQYCNEKSLKFACHNRITYYIALVVKRITRLFSSRLCIGINQKMLDKRIR